MMKVVLLMMMLVFWYALCDNHDDQKIDQENDSVANGIIPLPLIRPARKVTAGALGPYPPDLLDPHNFLGGEDGYDYIDFGTKVKCSDRPQTKLKLEWIDSAMVMVFLLGISLMAYRFYLYKPFVSRREYFFAEGEANHYTVALSLASSMITVIDMLGGPIELYNQGMHFTLSLVLCFIVVPIVVFLYIPIFWYIQTSSIFDYLGLRFSWKIKNFACIIYITQMLFYTPTMLVLPAFAISYFTNVNHTYITPTMFVLGVLLAVYPGIKMQFALDIVKVILSIAVLLLIAVVSSYKLGVEAIKHNYFYHSHELFRSMDGLTRHSYASVIIGGTFYLLSVLAINQTTFQKYICLQTILDGQLTVVLSIVFVVSYYFLNMFVGFLVVGQFSNCRFDRETYFSGSDCILYGYLFNTIINTSVLKGLFIGVLTINSLGNFVTLIQNIATVSVCNFCSDFFKDVSWARKMIIVFGATCMLMMSLLDSITYLNDFAINLNASFGGIMLGLFSLAMFSPWATEKAAFFGVLSSILIVGWVSIGSLISQESGLLRFTRNTTSLECSCNISATESVSYLLPLYKISYFWYPLIGFSVIVILGSCFSLFVKPKRLVDEKLLSPIVRVVLKKLNKSAPISEDSTLELRNYPQIPRVYVVSSNNQDLLTTQF